MPNSCLQYIFYWGYCMRDVIDSLEKAKKMCVYERDITSKYWQITKLQNDMNQVIGGIDQISYQLQKKERQIQEQIKEKQAKRRQQEIKIGLDNFDDLEKIAKSFGQFCPGKLHIGVFNYASIMSYEYTNLSGNRIIVHSSQSKESYVSNDQLQHWIVTHAVSSAKFGTPTQMSKSLWDSIHAAYPKYFITVILLKQGWKVTQCEGFKAKVKIQGQVADYPYDILVILA